LHDIQREIDDLSSLTLSNVADLLETKRRLTILQSYYSITYLIPNEFLSMKNLPAFEHVHLRSKTIKRYFLVDNEQYRPIYSILPQPLLVNQSLAKHLYPWTVYEHHYNINSKTFWWPQCNLIDPIHVSLTGLKASELIVANTELISTYVMLQNIDDIIRLKLDDNNINELVRRKKVGQSIVVHRNDTIDYLFV
jgi:hypothetical protein